MINDEAAEAAVGYLKDTSKAIGLAMGHMKFCEGTLKRVKSLMLISYEGSLGEREAKAYASDEYLQALEDHENAVAEYETLRALREAADWQLRVWQSETSSQRQGRV